MSHENYKMPRMNRANLLSHVGFLGLLPAMCLQFFALLSLSSTNHVASFFIASNSWDRAVWYQFFLTLYYKIDSTELIQSSFYVQLSRRWAFGRGGLGYLGQRFPGPI